MSGDKLARAAAVQPVVANRRVFVRRSILTALLKGSKQGLLNVRADSLARGVGDLDLNDAFVQAIHRHVAASTDTALRFAFSPDLEIAKLAKEAAEARERELELVGAEA